MSKAPSGGLRLWSVEPERSSARRFGKKHPLALRAHAEWMRLFLGRSLAMSQPSGNGQWEFLVPGTPCEAWDGSGFDEIRLEEIYETVLRDFAELAAAMNDLASRLHSSGAEPHQDLVLYGFSPLALLRLPKDPACWQITDEGLCIIDWGGEDGIPVFGGDAQESFRQILEIRRDCLARVSHRAEALGKRCSFRSPEEVVAREFDRGPVHAARASAIGKGTPESSDSGRTGSAAPVLDGSRKRPRGFPTPIIWTGIGIAVALLVVLSFMLGFRRGSRTSVGVAPSGPSIEIGADAADEATSGSDSPGSQSPESEAIEPAMDARPDSKASGDVELTGDASSATPTPPPQDQHSNGNEE